MRQLSTGTEGSETADEKQRKQGDWSKWCDVDAIVELIQTVLTGAFED